MKNRKSRKTLERITEVETHIHYYQESIALLHASVKGELKLQGKQHKRTQQDDMRMQWTLKNIGSQIQLLQHELTVLQEYGA